MARMGMDVERVEAAANALKTQAGQLDLLTRNLDKIVKSTLTRWEGPDAAHFVNEAWPGYRSGLTAALQHIRGLIQSMVNNVEEQRKGSEKGRAAGGADENGVGGPVLRLGVVGEVGGPAKHSAADRYELARSTSDDSDGVRIQGVVGNDNKLRYIVYLNGTVPSRLDDRGAGENISVLGVNSSTYNHVVQRMISQIQPPGSEVMVVGYSQGGIHAQLLAASGKFNITDVMTYGSPHSRLVDTRSDYNIVRIQDVNDNIPKLDPDTVTTAWRSILGDDKGAVEHLLARNDNSHDQTYDTNASVSGEFLIGTHGNLETYREGGSQYESQAQGTAAGRDALESQSRYNGTIVSDSSAPDAPVFVDNTWLPRY